jgi:hypothetical protein
METRILNPLKVALALASLLLFGFAPAAWADDGHGALAGTQAVTGVDRSAASAATSGKAVAEPQEQEVEGDVPGASAVGSLDHGSEASRDDGPAARPHEPAPIPGPDAASEPQATTPASAPQEATQPAAASATVVRETATPPSASQTTSTSKPGIPEALQEAIVQASGKQPGAPGGGDEGTLAAASNATTQLIWQVQISECVAHCTGITQHQTAVQQNSTRQVLAGTPAGAVNQDKPTAGEGSKASASPTQIQLGCLTHCSGATTTSATGPQGAAYLQLLQQVLDKLLHELLGAIAAALPGPSPAPAGLENAVAQVSYQSQSAPGPVLAQTQSVEQASAAEQLYQPPSALIAALQSDLGGRPAASAQAVNQTEQGVWQLQIGCLFFCEETVQYQEAAQSNTTIQAIEAVSDTASAAAASVANSTSQLIWQAQIGCLVWCSNTTQLQIATSENALIVMDGQRPVAPPPSAKSPTPPSAGSKPAVLPAAPGSSQSAGGGAPASASIGASTPLPVPTAGGVVLAPLPAVMPTSGPDKRRAVAPAARTAVLPAALTPAPSSAQLGVRAGRIALPAGTGGAAGPRASARAAAGIPAGSGTGPGVALGPADKAGSNVPTAALLAAIALFALVAGRVAHRARRG